MKTAIVIGATGLIGEKLCEALANCQEYTQVLAVVRSPRVWKNSKIKNILFDFSNWKHLENQLKGFISSDTSDGFCALGTTIAKAKTKEAFKEVDLHAVVHFAKTLNSLSSQKLFVVSAMGANKKSEVFYNQVKGEMEESVKSIFTGNSIFLRPSLLLGSRKEFRLAEKIAVMLAPLYSFIFIGPFLKWRPIRVDQIIHALVYLASVEKNLKPIYLNDDLINIKNLESF